MSFAELFIWGLIAHIVADWFLQSDWMAQYKTSLLHPASWIHSGIHFWCFLPVFGPLGAWAIFVSHILIDTRKPLIWWRLLVRQKMHNPNLPPEDPHNLVSMHVAFWQDQMAHVLVIALLAYFLP